MVREGNTRLSESLISRRKESWKRLEDLVARAGETRGVRGFSRSDLRELIHSYRRASSDLAIARVESRDQRLVSYLNGLVIRAHGVLYRTRSSGMKGVANFYLNDFPVIFRRTWRYTFATFLLFTLIALCSFIATWRDVDFADFAYVPPLAVARIQAGVSWWEELNRAAPQGAAMIMANNIGVSLKVFAMSVIPVAGTVNALMPSALQFGAINALILKYGMTLRLWAFVAGHGVLEFTAIFIAGGAGLMIGLGLLAPAERTRRDALVERGATAIRLLAGCIPLLIIAGLIEGFISPLQVHPGYKIAVSLATAIGLTSYLLRSAKVP